MNLFDLAAKISLDSHGFETGIKAAKSMMQSAAKNVKEITKNVVEYGEKIADVGEKAAKAVGTVSTATATAIGGLIKTAVENFGDYEQLVGGVETLFKDSADTVIAYAQNAYKTAGMSANEYMSTVTSFSASLLQGLGGDTKKATEVANKAITDMSDNANKMGSDISMIQYAYQGFAKQNYTMLDNLKLGYGGSASEMARLINDSKVLGDTVEVTAKTVKEVPFDQLIEAIHVIQTNLGITGTTAKEASETIQGSFAAAKAAAINFAVGLADETQDTEVLLENLIDSVNVAAKNLLPRIRITAESIVKIVEDRALDATMFVTKQFISAADNAPALIGRINTTLKTIITAIDKNKVGLKKSARELFSKLLDGFETTVKDILPLAKDFLPDIIAMFLEYKGTMFEVGAEILLSLLEGVSENSDEIAETAVGFVVGLAGFIGANAPRILPAVEKIVKSFVDEISDENALGKLADGAGALLSGLVKWIGEKLPTWGAGAEKIIERIGDAISEDNLLGKLGTGAIAIVSKIGDLLTSPKGQTMLKIGADNLIGALLSLIETVVTGDNVSNFLVTSAKIVKSILDGLLTDDNKTEIKETAKNVANEIANGVIDALPTLVDIVSDWGKKGRQSTLSLLGPAGEFIEDAGALVRDALNIEWLDSDDMDVVTQTLIDDVKKAKETVENFEIDWNDVGGDWGSTTSTETEYIEDAATRTKNYNKNLTNDMIKDLESRGEVYNINVYAPSDNPLTLAETVAEQIHNMREREVAIHG